MKNIQKHFLPVAVLLSFGVLVTLVIALSIKEKTKISAKRTPVSYTSSIEAVPVEEDMIPLSEEAMEELEYEDIVTEDEYEEYYLYNFLYIGDSFIQRLAKSGIIHESNDVLAKNGTAARDWYVQEDNDPRMAYEKTEVMQTEK